MPTDAPRYLTGHVINLVSGIILVVVTALATLYLRWENKQRDLGRRDHLLEGLNDKEAGDLGHNHPAFRYTV